jgi:hypothetical protein
MALTPALAPEEPGAMGLTLHTRSAGQQAPPASVRPAASSPQVDWRASLRRADHACCCPAKPVVVAIMPASAGRPLPVDLLLCGHHYRLAKHALAAAGAEVFDTEGEPLSPDLFSLAGAGSPR